MCLAFDAANLFIEIKQYPSYTLQGSQNFHWQKLRKLDQN